MFSLELPSDTAALVRGPARVDCVGGCRVFGGFFESFYVPPYKQYPVEGPASLKIDGGSVVFLRGSPIPEDWRLSLEGVVMLVGPTDSGKSGLSTYLVNTHVDRGGVCVVDADVGQSDIGPPGFVTCACTSEPAPHISELKPLDGYYVGSVNLQGMEELLVAGVVRCLRRVSAPLVLINTPGWTTGRGIQLLRALADAAEARVVNVGERILPGPTASRPGHIYPRSPQERRELRNLAYKKHISLKGEATAPAEALSPCRWEGGLVCPWGRYVPGDVERPEGKGRDYVVPRPYLRHILAGLYKAGRLAGYGVVERISDEGISLYTTAEDFDEVRIGKIRLDPQRLEELDPLP
ncbi:hypothetical protein TUZN_0716 [Thermoproteus uzoniensis 768-20]|uniref:polynucleotide 5'-hydroxyl-kinase n=1 Tax=Thermoproteus uzoniensis (strain 768-20) TaxID=999630 RepID=F2L4M8_THEU7|nr:Clp1/GlmU family protein [Thermoproteus uzoniensis]AEA12206.1 hypothetical protein TUZN_0716 [Thermoproteus uzoniensis 768-20]